jgi:hypothetical protein
MAKEKNRKALEIKSLDDLREYAVATLEKLENGEIETCEAGVRGKLCENIVSTLKVQMDYAKMTNRLPHIPFIGDCTTQVIEQTSNRKLLEK